MNANDNTREAAADDVIVLGIASIETQGIDLGFEPVGRTPMAGISEE
ncbi:benenodin family lasso peptide [Luteimonas sp. FCS-9]|nr:benenodin family lasso peptide [Luteimonas sp. FCS-9]